MVARQLAGRGIRDCRVLAAMGWVPREWFLPPHLASEAYEDAPLPIGSGQTISQPLIVALMTEALAARRPDRVLEIGTGSGYQTAILARLAARVYTIERLPDLLVEAEERFGRLGGGARTGERDGRYRDSGLHEDAQPVARVPDPGRRRRGLPRGAGRERNPRRRVARQLPH